MGRIESVQPNREAARAGGDHAGDVRGIRGDDVGEGGQEVAVADHALVHIGQLGPCARIHRRRIPLLGHVGVVDAAYEGADRLRVVSPAGMGGRKLLVELALRRGTAAELERVGLTVQDVNIGLPGLRRGHGSRLRIEAVGHVDRVILGGMAGRVVVPGRIATGVRCAQPRVFDCRCVSAAARCGPRHLWAGRARLVRRRGLPLVFHENLPTERSAPGPPHHLSCGLSGLKSRWSFRRVAGVDRRPCRPRRRGVEASRRRGP